jgi:hypothetical protein
MGVGDGMAMSTSQLPHGGRSQEQTSTVPKGMRMAGAALRAIFIVCLLLITVRVSLPQNETIWTAYDTPGDLVRLLLGFVVCLWIAIQLFRVPKEPSGYRTWLYFGLAAVPFALICLKFVW